MSTWYEKAVFYHMYPLGMTGAPRQHTDETVNRFAELNRWIPHMEKLNCSAVYIGPLFESSTHGYDTRDFKKVDRRLGANGDFKAFVSLCHEAGIRVVVDGVFNHTGREFFAFQDIQKNREQSRCCGWYKGLNFGWQSPMGDPFGYDNWRGIWELPCLDVKNPEVRDYLFDVIRFWVNEFDIDGIRLDCANVLDFQFMKDMRTFTDTLKDEFWLMGEVIHGEYSRWVNDETLHSVTNYELHKSIYSAHNDHNYFELAHNVRRLMDVGRCLYTFVDNHDEDRIASKLTNREHLKPVYTLLYTLPGIPSVYYGSEWGIEGHRSNTSDEALRPCIPADELPERENELSGLISRLGKIHRDEPACHGGAYQELLLTNHQYAFARSADGSCLITAANNDEADAVLDIPCPAGFQAAGTGIAASPGAAPDSQSAMDLLDGSVYPVTDNRIRLELKACEAKILKLKGGN